MNDDSNLTFYVLPIKKGHNVEECGYGHKITTLNTIDIFLL